MRWHTKPITQLVVMFAVMSIVIGAQTTASALFTGNTKNKSVAEVEETGLRKVAGGCSYRAGGSIQTGQTETNPQNANPRWPISDPHYRGEYDVLNSQYFIQQPNMDPQYRGYFDDGGHTDGNVTGMLGSMFGYRPNAFSAAYDMKYQDPIGQGIRGNDPSDIKGNYPILQIPVPANKEVLVARTGYDIGGGEAMVVFASADRVVLHIGRHEYFAGTGQCLNGPCSGGYWIYLSDVCVNDNIVDSYNSVKAAQEAAGPNLNPIQLPIVPEGYPLGRATGSSVKVALRDNGPFILMNKPFLWQGYPEQNFGTPTNTPAPNATVTPTPNPLIPTNTPAAGTPTNTPIPGTPTSTPTVTLTLPPDTTATPTPSGGATPTPAPTGPDIDEPTAGSRILRVFVSSSCTVEACARLRELMNNIQQGLLEGDNALLVWQTNGSSEWNFSRTTDYQYWEENNGNPPSFGFTVTDNPSVFPLMNEVQTLLLQITQGGSISHYFLK